MVVYVPAHFCEFEGGLDLQCDKTKRALRLLRRQTTAISLSMLNSHFPSTVVHMCVDHSQPLQSDSPTMPRGVSP